MNERTDIPAFPVITDQVSSMGMTLRDYFAALAMHAIIASPRVMTVDDKPVQDLDEIALSAYVAADAMLAERAK